jgi:ribosomal protein S18
MITQCIVGSATRTLSSLLQSNCRISSRVAATAARPSALRFLSGKSSGGGGSDDADNKDNTSVDKQQDSDPFGVRYDDGDEPGKLGPPDQMPPKYRRDAATGKFTGDVEAELTAEERRLLNMSPLDRDKVLLKRVIQTWENEMEEKDQTGDPKALADFARRVRLAKMSLNVLGRSGQAQAMKSVSEEGEELGRDKETGFTQPLTKSEFKTFQKYMRDRHGKEVKEDDVPVHSDDAHAPKSSSSFSPPSPLDDPDIQVQGITDDSAVDPDNPDLSLKWLTSRAQWEVNKKYGAEGPFDEMLPRDLNLSRIVNRKRARVLPRELLHHNNLGLLRRYISPAGQIYHRVRTRLGARDQRRIAKLIKRARNLGLIPHSGQFVVEDHGWIYEKDIRQNKPWEEELIRRGLVITKKAREANDGDKDT